MASLFSKTYLAAPAGQKDSRRLRTRLATSASASLYEHPHRNWIDDFVKAVKAECGCDFPSVGMGYDTAAFFRDAEFRDVLDSISILRDVAVNHGYNGIAGRWIEFAARAMREEGMAFQVDADGSVRYLVDAAFDEEADSVISALDAAQFNGAKKCIASAVDALRQVRPNGKTAIRDAFEGLETVFKVVTANNKSLDAGNVERLLQPIVSRAHTNADAIARGAADQLVQSFKDWVNACHKYRHGHNEPELVEPPLDLAVALVSAGLGFARWIAKF